MLFHWGKVYITALRYTDFMGKNQGIYLLHKGINRDITPSEASRGYLFISKDKEVRKKLGSSFNVTLNGMAVLPKKLDAHGRIFLGRDQSNKWRGRTVKIVFDDGRKTLVIETA